MNELGMRHHMDPELKQEPEQDESPKGREFVMPKKPKVAIVGCADSKDEVQFDNGDFEFWGVNNLHMSLPGPWSRWFDLHTFKVVGGKWLRKTDDNFRGQPIEKYLQSIQNLNIPVYMQKQCELVSNAVVYPVNDMLQMFGTYFTNTISYMIALAIAEQFEEIHILGVDMAVDSEYKWQRPSCEYFIGVARGKGIPVYLPDTCDLLKTRFLYGFHEVRETAFNMKLDKMSKSMKNRREKAVQQMEHAEKQRKFFERQMFEYNGALAANDQQKIHWSNAIDMWPSNDPKSEGGTEK